MRAVVQRVKKASVDILENGAIVRRSAEIGEGVLVLVAVTETDTLEDAQWLVSKISQMRIFEDGQGKMNLSMLDCGGDALVVSQFTLYGNMKKGNRPSFNRSARPEFAIPVYESFCSMMEKSLSKKIGRGEFGAMMDVSLVNDGPVTIILDSKAKDL